MRKELEKAKEFLENKWYTVAYIWVYWSQNYGLDIKSSTYSSDIDFKAVVLPSLKELIDNSKPLSTTIEYWDGQIDIKDIRVFITTLVKCNPAYVETLYTPHSIYIDEYKDIINARENLIEEQGAFLLRASYGMIKQKEHAFSHPFPSIKDKIDKYWYDPKQLHHIKRLFLLMKNYKERGEFVMKNNILENFKLKRIKIWKLSLEEALFNRDVFVRKAKDIIDNYTVEPTFATKKIIEEKSKEIIYNNILKCLKNTKR